MGRVVFWLVLVAAVGLYLQWESRRRLPPASDAVVPAIRWRGRGAMRLWWIQPVLTGAILAWGVGIHDGWDRVVSLFGITLVLGIPMAWSRNRRYLEQRNGGASAPAS